MRRDHGLSQSAQLETSTFVLGSCSDPEQMETQLRARASGPKWGKNKFQKTIALWKEPDSFLSHTFINWCAKGANTTYRFSIMKKVPVLIIRKLKKL